MYTNNSMTNILLKTSKVSALALSICLFVFGFSLSSCASTGNFMQPVMGETDMELLESSVPIAVKGAEIAHFAKPKNKTFASVSSMLYVMYANVFVQSPAEFLPSSEYVKQRID